MAYNAILIPQDYDFAHRMFEIGAASGEMDSLFNLGAQYLAGNGVDKDLQKGFEYLKKANRAGQWQAPLQVKIKLCSNKNFSSVVQYAEACLHSMHIKAMLSLQTQIACPSNLDACKSST